MRPIANAVTVVALMALGCNVPDSEPWEGQTQAATDPNPCAAVLCPPGSFCTVNDGQPDCISRDLCASFPCPKGQHCEAPADAPMCVPDRPSCICPSIYNPVCGVDGKTYGNACEARCAGVKVVHLGECKVEACGDTTCGPGTHCDTGECVLDDPCTRVVKGRVLPLCRRDQRCVVEEVICVRAPCPPVAHCEPGICICTKEYNPMCGVDGITYGNPCQVRCAGVAIAYPGACRPEGAPCGAVTCAPGLVCCNASCGICTPPGGVCLQILCEPLR